MTVDKILLTPDETAAALGLSRDKTYRMLREGLIPSVRIEPGKLIRVPVAELTARFSSNKKMD